MASNGSTEAKTPPRYELRNRFLFTGKLVMQTALHIGGGKATLSSSDSPVVLTPEQQPYIPGSSFKGALRSTVEKLAASLPGFTTCALTAVDEDELNEELKQGRQMKDFCSTARQWEITRRRQQSGANAAQITRQAIDELCDTCRLFGSPFAASRVHVSDLALAGDQWNDILEIRDGVAIDRDSERAKDGLKYDFEVVPASATFDLKIVLEDATRKDIQLLCVGLSEYTQGFGGVGGKRSRGLGMARLEDLHVQTLELFTEGVDERPVDAPERLRRLRQYLLNRTFSNEIDGMTFLTMYIESIFAEGGK